MQIVINECNFIKLVWCTQRLLGIRMRPVVENIVWTGTDAEDMDKYSSACLLITGNRLDSGVLLPEG